MNAPEVSSHTSFLTAEWRRLAFINYEVDPGCLQPWLPRGVELDPWQGRHLVSLVGFQFMNTRVLGLGIPFHRNFPEVNLRFYVRYHHPQEGWVRGVVFIKEIVPKPAITWVANMLYHERYATSRMKAVWENTDLRISARYDWKMGQWHHMKVVAEAQAQPVDLMGDSGFITEHYWGFSAHGSNTMSYRVAHPSWEMYPIVNWEVNADFGRMYGDGFAELSHAEPHSVMLAEGSAVSVKKGKLIS